MAKKDDDFDDFSLDSDGSDDDAFSAASEEDDEDVSGGDGDGSGDEAVESDFDDDAPKPKRARMTPAAKTKTVTKAPAVAKKKAPAAAVAKKAPAAVASAKTKGSPAKKSSGAAAAAPPQPAAAPPPIPSRDAKSAVLDYMRKTNRPYSMLNVFENMHRAIAKPALTKLLDDLCDKGELAGKTYGKAKIYYMNQSQLPVPSEDERASVEQQIAVAEDACAALEQELRASEGVLAGIHSQLSDAELETALATLAGEHSALEQRLATLEQPSRKPVSPGRKDALKRQFTKFRTAWVQRKRIVVDAVNQVADGMEKKPKAVYVLCGIETDEDAGVKQIPASII